MQLIIIHEESVRGCRLPSSTVTHIKVSGLAIQPALRRRKKVM